MFNICIVAAGGALGAAFRYLLGLLPLQGKTSFPFITLGINIVGALLMGFITALAVHFTWFGSKGNLFLTTGLLGGFTTFSAFALESVNLLEKGRFFSAAAYICGSVFLSLLAIYLGKYFAKLLY